MFPAKYELDSYTKFVWGGGEFHKLFKELDTQLPYKRAIRVQNSADSSKDIRTNYVPFLPKLILYYIKNSPGSRDRAGIGQSVRRLGNRLDGAVFESW